MKSTKAHSEAAVSCAGDTREQRWSGGGECGVDLGAKEWGHSAFLGSLAADGGTSCVNPKTVADTFYLSTDLRDGEQKFTANCSTCHGAGGVGTKQGPPLVHKVYEPNHHGDAAFLRAAANGVKSHHWQFGDMPKIDAVKPDDVEQIVKCVRWLQKQAGIF